MLRILLCLLALAVPTIASAECRNFQPFAAEWIYGRADLRHERVIWLQRENDGTFLANNGEVRALFGRTVATEIAGYLDALTLPNSFKAGIMFFDAREPYRAGSRLPVISHSGFLVPDSDG